CEQAGIRQQAGFAVGRGAHDDHESHCSLLVSVARPQDSGLVPARRMAQRQIDIAIPELG
ncbi:hypothetical protein, partial [Burkholderia sp. SIMBA_019]|uniref:hypothetical protein n=1 Tax=Burkholderia sp. SIMBA_019 TaxID=3085765 RepID=UPI00397AE046